MRVAVFYGGVPIKQNIDLLNSDQKPHIIVGTPGRILELVCVYVCVCESVCVCVCPSHTHTHTHLKQTQPPRQTQVRKKALKLDHVKRFVLDECDKLLDALDMRRDIQEIFRATPHEKQVSKHNVCVFT